MNRERTYGDKGVDGSVDNARLVGKEEGDGRGGFHGCVVASWLCVCVYVAMCVYEEVEDGSLVSSSCFLRGVG